MHPSKQDEDGGASSIAVGSTHGSPQLILPAPPSPSADRGLVPHPPTSPTDDHGVFLQDSAIDIFALTPVAALKMLSSTMEALVRATGDIPPTPPISLPTTPITRIVQATEESQAPADFNLGRPRERTTVGREGSDDVDKVPAKAKTPIGSPEAGPAEPLHTVGSNMEPLDIQHSAITRKFYSKKPPPIPLEEYLMRLHRYCPMSTAVYLATSLYIHKLAISERVISVTSRNVHRLLLAGLRVAMKALEDLSYPHRRFAKVGGVTEAELGRLEVSFCFLTKFELKVDEGMLFAHALAVRDSATFCKLYTSFHPKLPVLREKR
ncbi:hypothetical protein MMC06_006107 [Schaereria dolodes]|nr:hypothetical protein [Schaereria dolodes]